MIMTLMVSWDGFPKIWGLFGGFHTDCNYSLLATPKRAGPGLSQIGITFFHVSYGKQRLRIIDGQWLLLPWVCRQNQVSSGSSQSTRGLLN